MSNASIKARVQQDLLLLTQDTKHCEAVSKSLEANVEALEGISQQTRSRGRQLALNILHKGWAADEDLAINLEPEILAVRQWLDGVPE